MAFWHRIIIRRMEAEIRRLEAKLISAQEALEAEYKVSEGLAAALTQASNPANWAGDSANWYVDDEPVVYEVKDATGEVVEVIAPGAYDWQRLAWDIYDSETGENDA